MEDGTISREEVRRYLDRSITNWRKIRDSEDDCCKPIAPFYVDAYQCMRAQLLGEVLPKEPAPDEPTHVAVGVQRSPGCDGTVTVTLGGRRS